MTDFVTSRVILYKNGIGNFERKGAVENDTTIELFFPSEAMNDILKSINVTSNNELKHTITYDAPSSSSSTSNSPLATHDDLYKRLLRENVIIKTREDTVEGMVIAVDYQRDKPDNIRGSISIFTKNNLVCTFSLADVKILQIPNSLITQSKSLKINVKASQKQEITISYIRSCPVWKPTYRAKLGSSSSEYKLYGFATIHNPGPDDWVATSVSLVAGQPVSFINEVYKPKYKRRPKITAAETNSPLGISDLLVSSIMDDDDHFECSSDSCSSGSDSPPRRKKVIKRRVRDESLSRSRSRTRSRSPAPHSSLPNPSAQEMSTTSGSESVDLFRYDLNTPINLVHGHSALVPIFESLVQGKKVALFNIKLHTSHPFSALVMTNTTGLTLEAGSITVFDGDMYIGEAHLMATKPNEKRFLPFALETGVVLQQLPLASPSQPIHHVKIERTSVVFSRKIISKHHYVITNKSEKEIELLLEHPKSWSSDPTSISLVVEECYYGSEKSKSQIEVKTEYVTGTGTTYGHYGLSFQLPPHSITHLILNAQSIEALPDSVKDLSYFRGRVSDSALLTKITTVLNPYWELQKKLVELERNIRKEKDKVAELEKSQTRARSNLHAVQEKGKQSKYADQIDSLDDQINAADKTIRSYTDQLNQVSDQIKIVGDSLKFDSFQQ